MLVSLGITTICAQLVVTLRLFRLMPENGDPLLLPLLLLNAAGFTFAGMGSVAILFMIGDIVDEQVYRAPRGPVFLPGFLCSINSVGHFFAGLMLEYYVRLPSKRSR